MARRAGLTKAIVVETAGDLADWSGRDQLTLTALAAELGVRTPSLYAHVDGLDDLMETLRVASIEQLGARLTNAAVGRSGDEAIASLAHELRAFAKEHPARYEFTVRAPRTEGGPARVASDAAVNTLLAVLDGFGLHGDDAIHAARFLRSAVHGFASLEAASGFGLPVGIDDSFDKLVVEVTSALHRWNR